MITITTTIIILQSNITVFLTNRIKPRHPQIIYLYKREASAGGGRLQYSKQVYVQVEWTSKTLRGRKYYRLEKYTKIRIVFEQIIKIYMSNMTLQRRLQSTQWLLLNIKPNVRHKEAKFMSATQRITMIIIIVIIMSIFWRIISLNKTQRFSYRRWFSVVFTSIFRYN